MVTAHGPIDFVLIEFTADRFTGSTAQALMDLVERGIVRVYDLMLIGKDADGTAYAVDLGASSTQQAAEGFAGFDGAQSGLLGEDDLAEAAGAMEPGTLAALIIYENTWAIPFVNAMRRVGAELIASGRIPADEVIDTMGEIGRSMDVRYRETAGGGLAATPTGRRLARERLFQIKRSGG